MKKIFYLAIIVLSMAVASCAGGNNSKSDESSDNSTTNEQTTIPSDTTKLTVIDFNATWCGPCKAFAPIFEAAKESYSDKFNFQSVDIDENTALAEKYGIQAIPTIVIVDAQGNEIARQTGFMEKDAFEKFLFESK